MAWLTAERALELMAVKPQTLYANVSRGRIHSKPHPKDSRRRLYFSGDVERLARQSAGRRTVASVAASAIGWGDPVLRSSITTVADGRLWYRGREAVVLSQKATLEDTADLLWECQGTSIASSRCSSAPARDPSLRNVMQVLARRAADDLPTAGRSNRILAVEGAGLLADIATASLGVAMTDEPLHRQIATAWKVPSAAEPLRRALVLLADHELNASTFATRVAASTGAPLSAALLAGLATLTGPLHGGASARLQSLIANAERTSARSALRDWMAQGYPLHAFGHPLYPAGDVRANEILRWFTPRSVYRDLRHEVVSATGEQPNVDFSISALADAFGLPASAPLVLFALARSVGWIAHAIEQIATGQLIRPRAQYCGHPLEIDANPRR